MIARNESRESINSAVHGYYIQEDTDRRKINQKTWVESRKKKTSNLETDIMILDATLLHFFFKQTNKIAQTLMGLGYQGRKRISKRPSILWSLLYNKKGDSWVYPMETISHDINNSIVVNNLSN